MENDIITTVTEGIGTAEVVAAGAIAWLTDKLNWWKNIESKPVKVAVMVGAALVVAIVLSVITRIFT